MMILAATPSLAPPRAEDRYESRQRSYRLHPVDAPRISAVCTCSWGRRQRLASSFAASRSRLHGSRFAGQPRARSGTVFPGAPRESRTRRSFTSELSITRRRPGAHPLLARVRRKARTCVPGIFPASLELVDSSPRTQRRCWSAAYYIDRMTLPLSADRLVGDSRANESNYLARSRQRLPRGRSYTAAPFVYRDYGTSSHELFKVDERATSRSTGLTESHWLFTAELAIGTHYGKLLAGARERPMTGRR